MRKEESGRILCLFNRLIYLYIADRLKTNIMIMTKCIILENRKPLLINFITYIGRKYLLKK